MKNVTMTHEKPCSCGCADCEGSCGELDCLERPRFFCGQLLTDQDLSAMVGWTQDKFRLNRFRDGWGVACGLEVRRNPKQPSQVLISPGYALDCCGEDIVVCKETALDLQGACPSEDCDCDGSDGKTSQSQTDSVVDIFVSYKEQQIRPKHVMVRGDCPPVNNPCENSRTLETFQLSWRRVSTSSDPMQVKADQWRRGYEACLDLLKELSGLEGSKNPQQILLAWIKKHPLQQFVEIEELIRSSEFDSKRIYEILFYLVQDCRNAYLNCDCHGCDDHYVPLARVHVQRGEDECGRPECRVVCIDPYPPYRRPLSRDCWPAPLGQINLGYLIWHRWEEVCLELKRLGFHGYKEEPFDYCSPAEYDEKLASDLIFGCDKEIISVQVIEYCGATRVIGFRKNKEKPAEAQEPAPTVESTGKPSAKPKVGK
jgi:hypothetical protein